MIPRVEVAQTSLVAHGGRHAIRDGAPVRYDFSTCLNAFGPAEIVSRAIRAARVDEYPDPSSREACAAAAQRWCRPISEITFGAGAAELIHAACFAFLRPGDLVLVAEPSFGEYARSAMLCGGQARGIPLSNHTGIVDASPLAAAIERLRPRMAFIATPISPTGETVSRTDLERVADACATAESLLVLDQAYDTFVATPLGTPAIPGHANVLHVTSLTKDHALAGIRAGFAVGGPAVIDAVNRARVPWAASSVAQAAARAAMTDEAIAHVTRTTGALREQARRIAQRCAELGLAVSGTSTHYLTISCGNGAAARARLLSDHELLVRDCASFGFPDRIRVAAHTPIETDALIASLDLLTNLPNLPEIR